MASSPFLQEIDTVVVGNGPSALILSFILHGNTPYYNPMNPHPDPILHSKLLKAPCLLSIDVENLTAHFGASRLSYSTQALPINTLLDTLIRPLADTEPGAFPSCIEWRYESQKAIPHLVLGNTLQAGGQWTDSPIAASWDIAALSYAEMLTLPGYSLKDHYQALGISQPTDCYRPTRREIAEYLAAYPKAVGIEDSLRYGTIVDKVSRTANGFHIGSQNLDCKHLVLSSGVCSLLVPARPQLQPLLSLPHCGADTVQPLLVVGSGFTAADIILSSPPKRKIIHIFKWAPEEHPSPLRACHPQAYPEYAGVYRRMKIAAMKAAGNRDVFSSMRRRKSNPFFDSDNWDNLYEGFPNTYIKEVSVIDGRAIVTLESSSGQLSQREISNLYYVIGRRGSLKYLDHRLQSEVLGTESVDQISGKTLRGKVEETLELAPNVFAIGSLTGDSLVRFAFGGCVYAAREIIQRHSRPQIGSTAMTVIGQRQTSGRVKYWSKVGKENKIYWTNNGHVDLDKDRKGLSASIDLEVIGCGG